MKFNLIQMYVKFKEWDIPLRYKVGIVALALSSVGGIGFKFTDILSLFI